MCTYVHDYVSGNMDTNGRKVNIIFFSVRFCMGKWKSEKIETIPLLSKQFNASSGFWLRQIAFAIATEMALAFGNFLLRWSTS